MEARPAHAGKFLAGQGNQSDRGNDTYNMNESTGASRHVLTIAPKDARIDELVIEFSPWVPPRAKAAPAGKTDTPPKARVFMKNRRPTFLFLFGTRRGASARIGNCPALGVPRARFRSFTSIFSRVSVFIMNDFFTAYF